MKKDIDKIENIRQKKKEEQEAFLAFYLEKAKDKIKAFSFVPEIDKQIEKIAMNALHSYQESTTLLFPFYLNQQINRFLKTEATQFLTDQNISIRLDALCFLNLKTQMEQELGEAISPQKIYSALAFATSQSLEVDKEVQFLLQHRKKLIRSILPEYKSTEQIIQSQTKKEKVVDPNALTEEESKILGLFLGSQNDICMDIEEIAKKLCKKGPEVKKTLTSAFQKTRNTPSTKDNFFHQYPSCESLYDIRIRSILPNRTPKEASKKKVVAKKAKKEQTSSTKMKEKEKTEQNNTQPKPTSTPPIETAKMKKTKEEKQRVETKKEKNTSIQKKKATSNALTEKEIQFLKVQLQQDPSGFFPTIKEAFLNIDNSKEKNSYNFFKKIQNKLKDASNYQIAQTQIPNFQILWEEFLDNKTEETLSKRQQQIIKLMYYLKDGAVVKRKDEEIANLISTDVLSFEASYVKKQKIRIAYLLERYPNLKTTLKELLEEAETLKADYQKQLRFTIKEKHFLSLQLQQDEHGFFKTSNEMIKEMGQKSLSSYSNLFVTLLNKAKQQNFYQNGETIIPNFQTLWEEFLDQKTERTLSKRQVKILELSYHQNDDKTIQERSNEEIAQLMSTDGLSFDEVFVAQQKKNIRYIFQKYKDVQKEFLAAHPDYPLHSPILVFAKEKKTLLSEVEQAVLVKSLTQNKHGYFPTAREIKQVFGKNYNSFCTEVVYSIKKKLENEETYQEVITQIPNFQILWEEFLDQKTEKALSKRQLKILELSYRQNDDKTLSERSNEEIAKLMSTDMLSFDEVFVEQQKNFSKI